MAATSEVRRCAEERSAVLFNALPLRAGGAGVSTYIRELLGAIAGQVSRPLAAAVARGSEDQLPAGVRPIGLPAASGTRRALQGLRHLGEAELYHGLDVDLPLRAGCPTVATVHDLAVFDTPWAFAGRRVVGERLLVAHALVRADAVIAVSPFTAERVRALFGRDAVVVPEAPRRHFQVPPPTDVGRARVHYDLPERFVLHVGTVEPRKGLGLLAAACSELGVPLVAAGRSTGGELPTGVRSVGFVAEADLPALYGAATVSAYVSRYEGFGLPPLEAMACGCPVVSAPVPSTELVRGAVVIAPLEVEGLAAVLKEVLGDPARRAELAAAGPAVVRRLTWEAAARSTIEVYNGLGGALPAPRSGHAGDPGAGLGPKPSAASTLRRLPLLLRPRAHAQEAPPPGADGRPSQAGGPGPR